MAYNGHHVKADAILGPKRAFLVKSTSEKLILELKIYSCHSIFIIIDKTLRYLYFDYT